MFKTGRACSHDIIIIIIIITAQRKKLFLKIFVISANTLNCSANFQSQKDWIVECSMNLLKGVIWGDPTRTLAITKAKVDLCDYLGRSGLYVCPAFKCCLSEPEQTLLPLDVVVQHLVLPLKCIPAFVTQRPNACQLRGT